MDSPTHSGFVKYIFDGASAFGNVLFTDVQLLSFLCIIGVALVISALSQRFIILKEGKEIEKKIKARRISFSNDDIVYHQLIKNYLKLLKVIDGVGVLYFLAIIFLLIIFTFPNYSELKGVQPTWGYVALANLAFLFLFLPTFIICISYIIFRLFRYRLH